MTTEFSCNGFRKNIPRVPRINSVFNMMVHSPPLIQGQNNSLSIKIVTFHKYLRSIDLRYTVLYRNSTQNCKSTVTEK